MQLTEMPIESMEGFRLSPQQKHLWSLHASDNGLPYRTQGTVLIQGSLNLQRLEAAIAQVVEQHEILRTSFTQLPGMSFPLQVIADRTLPPQTFSDLTQLNAQEQAIAVESLGQAINKRPLDIAAGSLLHYTVATLSANQHVLFFSVPALYADITGLKNLVSQVSHFYASNGQSSDASPLQYADLAEWQNQLLEDDARDLERSYWVKQASQELLTVKLPFEQRRLENSRFDPRFHTRMIDADRVTSIRAIVETYHISLDLFLLVCWQILLGRLTGQPTVMIGFANEGRKYAELQDVIGLFTKYLPLPCQVDETLPIRQLWRQVQQAVNDAYLGQEYFSWEHVANETDNQTDAFLPFCFDFTEPRAEYPSGDVLFSINQHYSCVDRFKIKLSCWIQDDLLITEFHYDANDYLETDIQRLSDQFKTLLENILDNPEATIRELEILGGSERQQLLIDFNATKTEYPHDRLIHTLFEKQCDRTPNSIAVVFESQQLTYAELNTQANQLAHHLQTVGVRPEVLVPICMERSLETIVGILGILKAGGAYVPLDPNYPSDRLAFILQDTQSPVLLTQHGLLDKLPDRQHAKALCLDADRESWSSASPANPISGVTSDRLAYIIYTSGSTGQPKGVMVTHQNLVHSTTARFNYYHEPLSHFLLLSSFSFDSSIAGIFWTLCQGATLVLPQPNVQQDPGKIVELIAQQQISHLLCLPSLYALVLAQAPPQQLASLRTAIVAGEPCLATLVNLHYEQLPQATLFNEYGPTEATVWSSVHRCQPQDLELSVPIGHPISNTQIYLLDDQQRLVPIGVPGELYVGGEGVARGYLNRPDLTSEKFVTNLFSDQPTARLYRTGDLARYRPDGSLEFLDRIDRQVKIRGFRIELGEIEGILAQHPHIQDAVVLSWADPAGEKRLVAYIVADPEQLLTTSELRRFLNEKLPEYMLPATFIKLRALPRLPNGKLDRRDLPAPDLFRPDLDTRFVAPRTPIEQRLAQIWAEVLFLEQVGMHDNFFELGGDSIRSIQVMAKAQQVGLNFSLQQLFKSPTIEQLAQLVSHTELVQGSESELAAFSLIGADDRLKLPPDVVDAYPLAALQAGMLFHSEYSTDSSLYHDLISLHLRAPFDEQKLRLAFQAMAMRHAILRTSFDLTHFSVPLQLVHLTVEIPLVVEDLRHLSDRDQQTVLNDAFETEKQQHFDWQQPPLLRVRVHRRTDEAFQLTMVEHHAILDGWSTATMLTEVFQQYFALLNDSGSPLEPAPAITFRDFVALEQRAVQSLELQQYLMDALSDLTVTHLPRWQQSERSSSPTRQLGVLEVPLSADLSDSLKALAKQARVPLKSVVLAAHLRVMRLLGNQADVLTGLVANGRPEETGGERMLGLFLNTLPFRLNLLGGTWLDLIQETFQAEQAALPYRRYPLAEVQRRLGGKPLFETAFNFIHFHVYQGLSGLAGFDVVDVKSFEQTNFTLVANFSLDVISSQTQLTLTYEANELPEAQVEAIAGYYARTLAAMVAQPSDRYEYVTLLSESERHQLLVEWNLGQAISAQECWCLHQRFEAQVERTPDAVAVSFEGESLTYQTLNRRANQLARYLQGRGVTPGALVGICVDRSLDLVIGLLAILKAGGAYVPLDPIYPPERLGFMLADSQVSVLLTQQRLVAGLPEHQAQVICLDTDWSVIAQESPDNLPTKVEPEDLAYVIYTSGSTGKPKGVLVQHDNVSRLFSATQPWFEFNDLDVWTLFHSYAFDFSVWELWGALLYGGRVVVVPACVSRSPQAFYELLCQEQVTILNQTPSAFRQLIQVEELLEQSHERPGLNLNLRYVIFGGEALELQSLKPWFERHSEDSPQLVNMYGITETTVHATYRPLSRADLHRTGSVIGRPLPDLQVYLLDRSLHPVPIGVTGELYIGGGGVTRGYLNRSELTRDRFIPNPFSEQPDARLYKSGDLARYLPNGELEYLGRIDHQVKIHGFRIELGEIESALMGHPNVRETVVLSQVDSLGNAYLIGYIVLNSTALNQEQSEAIAEFRSFLKQHLPEYMVPVAFVILDALPLTPNGKVNQRALPQPDLFQRSLPSRLVAPHTLTEEILASVWSNILKVESSIHDSFFELGGHSLLATQLISRLRSTFAIDLPLRSLFEFPTIAELATHIEALRQEQQADRTGATDTAVVFPLLVPDPDRQDVPFPLTDIQQAYWMGRTAAFDLGNVSAHSYIELESEHIDLERLTQALHKLIACHAMLRAVMLPDGQQQILTDVPAYQIAVLDLSGQNAAAIAVAIETVRQQMSHQVLPADRWPLFEIRATRFRAQHIRLHISFDALIADAWSIRCLAQQLVQLYQHPDQNLTAPELSFRDYVLAEERLQTSDFYRRSQTYWFDRLHTLPPAPELPLAKQPSSITQPQFKGRCFRLNSEQWQQLKHRAVKANLTPSAVILTAFAEVLTLWSKSPRFTINLTLFNRLPFHPHVAQLVGDFTSLTLLEVDNSTVEAFSARVQRLQRQLWQDLDHRYVSGVRVLRELTRRQGRGQTVTMPVVFTSTLSLDAPEQAEAGSNVLGEVVYNISQTPQVWLDHQVAAEEGGLLLNWDAVEDLFPAGLLDDMFDTYCRLICDLATSHSAWVESDRSLLPAHQSAQRAAINATAAPRSDQLLHMLFTAQVEARSQSYAVLSPSRNLTYSELSQLAHQVGHRLRQMGAAPNTLVAVVMEKGWEQVVAVLGILMAGAAYLPIDPELPTERQQYLLQQANVRIVLTQSKLNLTQTWNESIQRICLDSDELAEIKTSSLEPVQTPGDLAYVIYTSGSTGLPKGVMIDHQGAVNTILDINQRFQVTSSDRVLALSALSFDLSVYDIFGTLAAGGTLVIPAVADIKNPAHWLELIQQQQVTVWNSVPALLQMLVEYVTGSQLPVPDSLRLALLSGDWLPLHLPDQVKILFGDIQVVSLGGATEASIWSIFYPIAHVDKTWKSIPYGQPLRNQSFHVLNQHLEPCPVWVPGQLYIGGIGLAQGYWQDEQKTRDQFIIHPQTQERLYKTGDLGRFLPDGNIEFLGREDFQIKVNGYRIELGEIEAALTDHPAVKEGIVTAVGEEQAYKQLVAYVVVDPERMPITQPEPAQKLVDAYEPSQLDGVLSDSAERIAFKLKQPGVRKFQSPQPSVALPQPEFDHALTQAYLNRQSYRQFLSQPIPLEEFSHFLSCLLQRELPGAPLPKYRYPSAGNLYPVQTYLYLKPNRVAGLEAGFYYYHPADHRLVLLNSSDTLTGDLYGGNQPTFEQSAFALFLIGHLEAIAPMYGELGKDFCLLEAGYMSQLLMTQAPDYQLGLCPIGFLEFEPLQACLSLDSNQILLHSFVGGSIDPVQTQQWLDPQPTQAKPLDVQLRQCLQQKLPEYMIPKAFVLLEKFPLTPNGKVDRAALPAPEGLRSTTTTTYVAPRTELEQTIAALWQEVLQIETVGLHDNFFDLGGHSLSVIQVHKKLQEQLNRELSVIELFRSPTISALAKQLTQDAINPAAALHTTTQMDDIKSGRNRLKQRLARTTESTKNREEVL